MCVRSVRKMVQWSIWILKSNIGFIYFDVFSKQTKLKLCNSCAMSLTMATSYVYRNEKNNNAGTTAKRSLSRSLMHERSPNTYECSIRKCHLMQLNLLSYNRCESRLSLHIPKKCLYTHTHTHTRRRNNDSSFSFVLFCFWTGEANLCTSDFRTFRIVICLQTGNKFEAIARTKT